MNDIPRRPLGDGGDGGPEEPKDITLRGAAAIAEELLGDAGKRRSIYHLVETSRLPVFRLGAMLCARRSTLRKWIEEQEGRVPTTVGGHHRRGEKKDRPDEPTPTPACPPPRPRGPMPAGAAGADIPTGRRPAR